MSASHSNVVAAGAFVVMMLVVGVPVWWQTTQIYRVPLPYATIGELDARTLTLNIPVEFVLWHDDEAAASTKMQLANELLVNLKDHQLDRVSVHERMQLVLDYSLRVEPSATEVDAFRTAATIAEADARIVAAAGNQQKEATVSDERGLTFYLLSPSSRVEFGGEARVYLGKGRAFYYRLTVDLTSSSLLDDVTTTIRDVYLGADELEASIVRSFREMDFRDEQHRHRSTASSIGAPFIHPELSVELYVLNPEPDRCRVALDDVERTLAMPLRRALFAPLANALDTRIQSQMLYYVDLSDVQTAAARGKGENGTLHYLRASQLPLLINPLEHYVGASTLNRQILNVLVYFTPEKYLPLYVSEDDSAEGVGRVASAENGYVVSSWGALAIYNRDDAEAANCSQRGETTLNASRLLPTVLGQLRRLLGISGGEELLASSLYAKTRAPLAAWELDRFHVQTLTNFLFSAISTLRSLADLLAKISNIVINDDVGREIADAVDAASETFASAERGAPPASVLVEARRSFEHSERAFFDPSLLALLYFPDDQKYAIYVPLFLPVGVPVLFSLRFIVSYLRARKQKVD